MQKRHITPAMIELRHAITEAETLSAKAELSKRDEQRINVLLAKIASLRANAVAPDDYNDRFWRSFLTGQQLPERRGTDLLAGTQSITFGSGAQGGVFVPQEFHDEILYGLSVNDPLLNPDLVTMITSSGPSLRPMRVAGWDLSTFAAVKVAEGTQQTPQAVPAASNVQLGGFVYKATLDDSIEFEEDDFQPTIDQITVAFASGFAKGIGTDLVTGNGTTAPQGVLTGAINSGITTTTAGGVLIIAADIESIYFSLDEAYRTKPKCAWVMNDTTYQNVRKAVDTAGRPLISVLGDKEVLMGKPVLVSPSMPSGATQRAIVFGDMSHLVVRVSRMSVVRSIQAAGYAEAGKALYTGRMRADAKVVEPTSGTKPAIVFATMHA